KISVEGRGYMLAFTFEICRDFHVNNMRTILRATRTARKYLINHPKSTIINIGAGLSTAFYRVDNGQLKWYDLDLPNVIALRKKYFAENPRVKCISTSIFDYSWFDQINSPKEVFFVANGVFIYFDEFKLKELFLELINNFPSSEIAFDVHSKVAITIGNKMNLQRCSIKGKMRWGINRVQKILKWNDRIEVIDDYPMYAHIPRNTEWGSDVIAKMNLVDDVRLANIFHLRFN
ncbi:MAG: class I SAM-dependent methyltransferase, partial [Promethearchaeota archaeon]